MEKITRNEANYLRTHGLEKYVHLTNKKHKKRSKTYYAASDEKVSVVLEEYKKSIINE